MTDDITAAELSRNYGRLEALVTGGFDRIEAKLDSYVLKSVHEAEMRGTDNRISEVEKDLVQYQARQRWVVGLMATIGLALLGLVLSFWSTFGPPQI